MTPKSREMLLELARKAIDAIDARAARFESLTPEEQEKDIEAWAKRLAAYSVACGESEYGPGYPSAKFGHLFDGGSPPIGPTKLTAEMMREIAEDETSYSYDEELEEERLECARAKITARAIAVEVPDLPCTHFKHHLLQRCCTICNEERNK